MHVLQPRASLVQAWAAVPLAAGLLRAHPSELVQPVLRLEGFDEWVVFRQAALQATQTVLLAHEHPLWHLH